MILIERVYRFLLSICIVYNTYSIVHMTSYTVYTDVYDKYDLIYYFYGMAGLELSESGEYFISTYFRERIKVVVLFHF